MSAVFSAPTKRPTLTPGPIPHTHSSSYNTLRLRLRLPLVAQRAINSVDFEDTDASRELQLTAEPEQFVGFQLERITRTTAVVLDNATEEGVAGFTLKVCISGERGIIWEDCGMYVSLGCTAAVVLGDVLNADYYDHY